MTILKVGSWCRYLTESDGVKWRSADYDARNIVKAIKGKPFGGHSTFKIGGRDTRFDSKNAEELVGPIIRTIGSRHVAPLIDQEFEVVPIPNSGMAIDEVGPFRIAGQAQMFADACVKCVGMVPALRWAEVRVASHQGSGYRSPSLYEPYLRYVGGVTKPVVLFDDVITSGSQMIAAARVLRANGVQVLMGVTVGSTVKTQHEKMIEWTVSEHELDPKVFDFDEMFGSGFFEASDD